MPSATRPDSACELLAVHPPDAVALQVDGVRATRGELGGEAREVLLEA
jgi:hypothetical protein